jgi:hypothetical protein
LIGFWLAPLGTTYSLELDRLLPVARRAEGFALLRSAQAVGTICSGVLLAVAGVTATFATSATLAVFAVVAVLAVAGAVDGSARELDTQSKG